MSPIAFFLLACVWVGAAAANQSPSQIIANSYYVGLCMFDDLIVSPSQQNPPAGNVPVQSTGANVYARQSDNSYVLQQHLGADILVVDCAVSATQIVLTTFTQSTPGTDKIYSLFFFELVSQPGAATRQWKQSTTLVQTWPSTGGIVSTTIDMTDEYLALTSQYPNPVNTGTVYLYRRDSSGVWAQSQQIIAGKVDVFGEFPILTASINGQRLLVTALPGMASNSTAAINIYRAGAGGVFEFESEVGKGCTWAVLGAGDVVAAATKNGVDLYKLASGGNFALVDSLSIPSMADELRGTKSLQMSPDGNLLVRGLGQYNYDSRTGCAVYSLAGQKVSQVFDSYAQDPLTMACVAGQGAFGVGQTDSLAIYIVK